MLNHVRRRARAAGREPGTGGGVVTARATLVVCGAIAVLSAVVACAAAPGPGASGSAAASPGSPGPTPSTSSTAPAAPASGGATGAPPGRAVPASCARITLREGEVVPGSALGACLLDYVRAVRSYHYVLELPTGDPARRQTGDVLHARAGTYAEVMSAGERLAALTPQRGWMVQDGAVVEGDENGPPAEAYADALLTALRGELAAEFVPSIVSSAAGFRVAGRTQTALDAGTSTFLWTLVSTAPVQIGPAGSSVVTLYFPDPTPGPLAKVVTEQAGVTGSRWFTNWGEVPRFEWLQQLAGQVPND